MKNQFPTLENRIEAITDKLGEIGGELSVMEDENRQNEPIFKEFQVQFNELMRRRAILSHQLQIQQN